VAVAWQAATKRAVNSAVGRVKDRMALPTSFSAGGNQIGRLKAQLLRARWSACTGGLIALEFPGHTLLGACRAGVLDLAFLDQTAIAPRLARERYRSVGISWIPCQRSTGFPIEL
jgi:hypothetical protein